ncbi:MAG TPA: hypothetical protein DEP51_02875 [Clostridiales bacterium]|nr:hypothetical protein [Clostridiales bacterium]
MMEENNNKEKIISNNNNENIENTEIPKALQNKEINNDTKNETDDKTTITEVKNDMTKENEKSNNKKFKKFYIIFVVVLVLITIIATYITIMYINSSSNQINETKEEQIENDIDETNEIAKRKAEDEKYALRKYSETYNENDLIFNDYIDINGEVKLRKDIPDIIIKEKYIGFIQIDGLKDKQVQTKINNLLKEKAYSFGKDKRVGTDVTSSFSNVLGVSFYMIDERGQNEKNEFLHIDLSTGNEIPFEEIFVSSAPIKSILAEGMYKTLAWETKEKNTNEENWEDDYDISKADISDFEDKSINLAKKYEKEKGKIKYSLYFDKIIVYDLLNGITDKEDRTITIDFVDHLEDIAIYKRFLTEDSLFENSDIGLKNIIVCEYPKVYGIQDVINEIPLNIGFISDNVYMEDFFECYISDTNNNTKNKITKYLQDFSNDTKKRISNNSDNGLIFQRIMYLNQSRDNSYYYVELIEVKATSSIEYFNDSAFKDYIKLKLEPRADAGINIFSDEEFAKKRYPNLTVNIPRKEKCLYFSLDGEYIGDNEEEAIRKTQSKDENNATTVQNVIPNIDENNNIGETNTNNSTTINTNIINNSNTSSNVTNDTNNSSNTTNNAENTNTNSNINTHNSNNTSNELSTTNNN